VSLQDMPCYQRTQQLSKCMHVSELSSLLAVRSVYYSNSLWQFKYLCWWTRRMRNTVSGTMDPSPVNKSSPPQGRSCPTACVWMPTSTGGPPANRIKLLFVRQLESTYCSGELELIGETQRGSQI